MSPRIDSVHVLYVGHRPTAVASLPDCDATDARFLASVAADPGVADAQLGRADVDCLVCEEVVLDPETWSFLHRIADRFPELPVVLRMGSAADRTAVPDGLYDIAVADASPTELAAAVLDAVADAEAADGPSQSVADLLDPAEEYVAHIERDGTVRMVSASAAAWVGRSVEETVGERLVDLVDETFAEQIMATGREVLETGERREIHDGSDDGRHYHVTFEPVNGDVFEVVVRDVTATKRAERAFREERAFLESVVDSLRDVFFVLDLEFRFVRWNDRVNEVTGWSDEELRGADALQFFSGEGAERAHERLAEAISEGRASAQIDVISDPLEEPTPFEWTVSVVRDEMGEARYICGIGRDISERRATERELDAAIEELERSNAELEQFAYVASHDLKEPLRMVSSYLQLLERRHADDLDGDAREFIEFAVDGAERMQEMIRDLLEYSRVGRRDGEFEAVDCEAVLGEVQRNLEVAIDEQDATVEVGSLPTVRGDRSRLVELFQNLVSNALKYSGESTPHVEVTATRAAGDEDRWEITVADNGRGIPEDRIDRVFDLFYRSDVQDSTGIGLALAKKIVESHGGDIRVESTPGEGATFYVELPVDGKREE
jgi:PAS domain S-box-containing protein